MTFAWLAVSAIAPSLILVWFFHARDAFPEPPKVLWTTFFLGVATVAPVLLFAWPAYHWAQQIGFALAQGFVAAFFGAAIPEEIFKLLVLWGYSMRQRDFDEPMDGIVYGVTASLGFATLENILYVSSEGGATAIMRAFTAVPGHALLGAIMGYFVGRAQFATDRNERRKLLGQALLYPTLLHGAYDWPLLAANALEQPDSMAAVPVLLMLALVPTVLCIELLWTARLVRRTRLAQLAGGPPPVAVTAPSMAEPGVSTLPAVAQDTAVAAAAAVSGRPSVPSRSRRLGWLLTVLGGLLASGGGLIILGVMLGMMVGGVDSEEIGDLILGTLIIGFLPAGVGSGLFLWGVRRLNRSDEATPRV